MFSGAKPDEIRVYDLAECGRTMSVSEHFRIGEFACRDKSDIVLLHPALVALLEEIRAHFGVAVTINSAYRTPSYNATIGGKTKSQHIRGYAADIVLKGVKPADVATYAESLGVGGVGRYPESGFTHVDVWSVGRRWNG